MTPNTNRLNAAIDELRQVLAQLGLRYSAGTRIERAIAELEAERTEKQAEIAKLPKKPFCPKCGSEKFLPADFATSVCGLLIFPAQCGDCGSELSPRPDPKGT